MCCAGCAELKIDEKCKESSLFSYISSTLEVWNLNIRFNMAVCFLHRFGTGCIFSTRIERQHVARLIESDLVYIFHSTNWLAPVSTQAGMFLKWSTREQRFVTWSIWYKRV